MEDNFEIAVKSIKVNFLAPLVMKTLLRQLIGFHNIKAHAASYKKLMESSIIATLGILKADYRRL